MSVHKSTTSDHKKPPKQDPAVPTDQQVNDGSLGGGKELEPAGRKEEAQLLKEVVERSAEADRELEEKTREDIRKEVKVSKPDIEIPPDLKDHGVKSPQQDASQIVLKGSTIELPISEESYKKSGDAKVSGSTSRTKVVSGVKSIAALALLIGKIIKIAHKRTMNVIFKKGAASIEANKGAGTKESKDAS